MKYTILLWPHANARYRSETLKLALAETSILLNRIAPQTQISAAEIMGIPALKLDCPQALSEDAVRRLSSASLLYGLFEDRDDALVPVCGRENAYLGEDLPGILKYKGKTNELFTQLLMNVGLYAGDFWNADVPIRLYDPMCGRGTTLFLGANRRWLCTGSDVDKNDLHESEMFFKRYLEYHKFKHRCERESLTVQGKKPAPCVRFDFADSIEHFKQKQTASLRLVNADAKDARAIFGNRAFHLIVCDLPYGVQHASQGGSLEELLEKMLPVWRETLQRGGTVALSYNAQTLKTERVRELMLKAGMAPAIGGAWDSFAHWVEQAVTRDVAVCRRD